MADLVNFDNFPFVLHLNISSLAGVKKKIISVPASQMCSPSWIVPDEFKLG